jgi:N-acylglucosamine-6-phosphate 2-epimerase
MTGRGAILERLRGGLIVSVQAYAESVLDTPPTIALLARCAAANDAVGVRVESVARIAAVRAAVDIPIVGIIKRAYPGFEPYITTTPPEIAAVAAAGAEIVAFDATARPRFGAASIGELAAAAHAAGCLAMADCATEPEGLAAMAAGVDIVATTLAGYTAETHGRALPALDVVAALAARHPFVVCEGGIATPEDAGRAFASGAAAIVVGTAITNVDALVRRFAQTVPRRGTARAERRST